MALDGYFAKFPSDLVVCALYENMTHSHKVGVIVSNHRGFVEFQGQSIVLCRNELEKMPAMSCTTIEVIFWGGLVFFRLCGWIASNMGVAKSGDHAGSSQVPRGRTVGGATFY